MASSLAEIRARLAAQENKTQRTAGTTGDGAIFPHWNIPEGSTTTLRFLPDGNAGNEFFWVERQQIKLPFNGVIGRPDIKRIDVQVPCVEAYGGQCPVHAELRTWYKDESLKEMANRYWKKRSYIFQGFVRVNSLLEDKAPENPVRKFIISPQIFTIIKSSLLDPEMEELPTDYMRGLDFNVKKTSKGGYADYSTSNWARKESALTAVEQAAIDQYGLFNLAEFLPKKPTDAELEIIMEMFNASVDNKPYDLERWGNYYKPWGLGNSDDNNSNSGGNYSASNKTESQPQSVAQAAPAKETPWEEEPQSVESVKIPTKPAAPAVSSDKAQDILAMIRARQAKTN